MHGLPYHPQLPRGEPNTQNTNASRFFVWSLPACPVCKKKGIPARDCNHLRERAKKSPVLVPAGLPSNKHGPFGPDGREGLPEVMRMRRREHCTGGVVADEVIDLTSDTDPESEPDFEICTDSDTDIDSDTILAFRGPNEPASETMPVREFGPGARAQPGQERRAVIDQAAGTPRSMPPVDVAKQDSGRMGVCDFGAARTQSATKVVIDLTLATPRSTSPIHEAKHGPKVETDLFDPLIGILHSLASSSPHVKQESDGEWSYLRLGSSSFASMSPMPKEETEFKPFDFDIENGEAVSLCPISSNLAYNADDSHQFAPSKAELKPDAEMSEALPSENENPNGTQKEPLRRSRHLRERKERRRRVAEACRRARTRTQVIPSYVRGTIPWFDMRGLRRSVDRNYVPIAMNTGLGNANAHLPHRSIPGDEWHLTGLGINIPVGVDTTLPIPNPDSLPARPNTHAPSQMGPGPSAHAHAHAHPAPANPRAFPIKTSEEGISPEDAAFLADMAASGNIGSSVPPAPVNPPHQQQQQQPPHTQTPPGASG
ncbi:hypothetical protein BDV06DRAFT_221193 [Aspergillus oleicola]